MGAELLYHRAEAEAAGAAPGPEARKAAARAAGVAAGADMKQYVDNLCTERHRVPMSLQSLLESSDLGQFLMGARGETAAATIMAFLDGVAEALPPPADAAAADERTRHLALAVQHLFAAANAQYHSDFAALVSLVVRPLINSALGTDIVGRLLGGGMTDRGLANFVYRQVVCMADRLFIEVEKFYNNLCWDNLQKATWETARSSLESKLATKLFKTWTNRVLFRFWVGLSMLERLRWANYNPQYMASYRPSLWPSIFDPAVCPEGYKYWELSDQKRTDVQEAAADLVKEKELDQAGAEAFVHAALVAQGDVFSEMEYLAAQARASLPRPVCQPAPPRPSAPTLPAHAPADGLPVPQALPPPSPSPGCVPVAPRVGAGARHGAGCCHSCAGGGQHQRGPAPHRGVGSGRHAGAQPPRAALGPARAPRS